MSRWRRYTHCRNCGMGSEDEAVEVNTSGDGSYAYCHYCGARHYVEWGNKIELDGVMCPTCLGEGETVDDHFERNKLVCPTCKGKGYVEP